MPGYSLIFPAALLALVVASASAQIPPDPGAVENVRQAQRYDQMLRSSPSFRAQRMQIECGPITDPQLLASCVASFQAYGPTPPPRKRGT